MFRTFLVAVATVTACLINETSAEEPVLPGESFVSPNGQYCLQLEVIDGLLRFVIKNRKTKGTDDSVQSTGPLYLHWATNSKSFVTVEHISKGSYGRVVYLVDDRWVSIEVKPPFKGKMEYGVIGLQLEPDRVHYKFAVTKLSEGWAPLGYTFCDLDVNLATGEVGNIKSTSASEAEFANAPDESMCVPKMARERHHDLCN